MPLNLPYITWRELPPLHAGAKPRKVPWNVSPGVNADGSRKSNEYNPHNSEWWMTHEQCMSAITGNPASELRAGVVLTDNDPYFLLDLDDCHDGTDWTDGAKAVAAMFQGVAIEVSISGKGLHIVGQCAPAALGDRRNKFTLHGVECEFYHTGRFMALGAGFTGNFDLDCTAILSQIVPAREAVEKRELIDVADSEWSGPDDDDELIALMIASRGSAAAVFGSKATVNDLWVGNVDALSVAYPSVSGDQYDRSSADAALMAHLAFWTGKNTARMDRLFRRSALMRPKYEKHGNYDYAGHTVSSAVANTRNVYKQSAKFAPQQTVEQSDDADEEPDEIVPDGFGEIMSINDQISFFTGCTYVTNAHRVLIPSGQLLKPAQFKTLYGGHCFLMSADGSRPSYNAFEAFTENRAVRFPKVHQTRFKPAEPFGKRIEGDGVNIYVKPDIETFSGDVSPILGLLQTILPDEYDRAVLLAWMAALVQYPGVKFLWSPVMQGVEGNGKSIWGEILFYCVGSKYSWTVEAKKIDSQFNNFLSHRLFINVEEMNLFAKFELMDTLKGLITGTRQEVEQKGVDSDMDLDYCANWYFATNHKGAVVKTRNDRRFAMFFTAQQTREELVASGLLSDNYFPRLWHWLRHSGGFAMMRHYLMTYAIPDELNPATSCFLAPVTSSTTEAVTASYNAAEQHVVEAIDSGLAGFKNNWISTAQVTTLLKDAGIKKTPVQLQSMIEGLGFELRGRSTRHLMHEGNAKPRLYARPGVTGLTDEYEIAQGYR